MNEIYKRFYLFIINTLLIRKLIMGDTRNKNFLGKLEYSENQSSNIGSSTKN